MRVAICAASQHSDKVDQMAHAQNMFESYAASSKSAFDYWISFFPTAPMFGVEWRFGELATPDTKTPVRKAIAEPEVKTTHTAPKAAEPSVAKEAATPPVAKPKAAKAPSKPKLLASRPDHVDPLTKIKGVGPGLEKQLHALGIYTFAQLSDLNDEQLAWLDDNMMTVKGRCIRDDWSGQANSLQG